MAKQYRTFSIRRLARALQGFSVKGNPGDRGTALTVNNLLFDATPLLALSPEEVEELYFKNPIILFSLLEISRLASLFTGEVMDDREFLALFRKHPPTSCFLYFFSEVPELSTCTTSGVHITQGSEPSDIVGFMQNVLRFAHLFYNFKPFDLFHMLKLVQSKFIAGAVLWDEPDEFDLNLIRALRALNVPLFSRPAIDPWTNYIPVTDLDDVFGKVRMLKPTIGFHKVVGSSSSRQSSGGSDKVSEFGGTYSSFFVTRAMGGTDGVEVRGNLGKDVGLIVDIGDSAVDMTLSLYIEEELGRIFTHHPWLRFNLDGFFKIVVHGREPRPSELANEVYRKLKERFLLNQVSVNLIFDVPRLQSLKPTISAYKEERKNAILRRTDADLPLLACTYCQRYSKNGFCLISVSRPPQCELSYDAVRASAVLTNSIEAFCVDKGELVHRQRGVYTGANKFARILSEGEIKEISLHSLRFNPPPVTAYAQNLAYYNEELGAIFILSSDFGSTAPDGKSFLSLLKACVGKQVPGVMPLSDSYILSKDFLNEEGGIGRVVWMPHALKERLGLSRVIHIATERECCNMFTLKVFLRERGFRF